MAKSTSGASPSKGVKKSKVVDVVGAAPRKKLTKAEKLSRRSRNERRLLKRSIAAQKWSWLNFLPRSLPAREFKFFVKQHDSTVNMIKADALMALREMMQLNAVRVLQHVSADNIKTGKTQVTPEAVRSSAFALGIDASARPTVATVLTARGK